MSLFSAQNRVPLTVPGGEAAQPSIQVDSNLRRWFSRNLGLWRSRRQYTFSDDQVLHLDMNLKMEAFAHPCLLYTSPSPRDVEESRMPSSA